MSLLEALKKRKTYLKITDTVVKTTGGDVYLEKRDESGNTRLERLASTEGFVVDLKPDLQVAMVLSGLCVGSQDVTQDRDVLHKHNITHVLSLGIKVQELPGFKYTFIEALDLPEFNLKSILKQSEIIIDSVINSGGVVFVHCNAGVSRSVSVVIAYLMKRKNLKYQEALDLVKKKRPCAKPNEGFTKQLRLLEKELFCE